MPLCSAITPKGTRPKDAVYFRPLLMPRFIVLAGNQRILEKRLSTAEDGECRKDSLRVLWMVVKNQHVHLWQWRGRPRDA